MYMPRLFISDRLYSSTVLTAQLLYPIYRTSRSGRAIVGTRLYLYSGKLTLAATYFRRVFLYGRSFTAGAPALTHVWGCSIKPRRGPPAALPGAGLWRHAWGDGAHMCQHGAMARITPARPATPHSKPFISVLFVISTEIRNPTEGGLGPASQITHISF
jgi:hypothetical protein